MSTAIPSAPYIGKIKVHNHGHVILEKVLGDEKDVLANARVSFNADVEEELTERDLGVLNFLMRERHGSPWEAVVLRFDIKCPIFVMREWHRHRISSFNEHSARYSKIPEHFYVPDREAVRQQVGKPGSYSFEPIEDPALVEETLFLLEATQKECFRVYNHLMDKGVAKELARTVLPMGFFSRMKWTVNLRGLFNFLSLRNHKDAQREIREYAIAVEELVAQQLPAAMKMFNEHERQAP